MTNQQDRRILGLSSIRTQIILGFGLILGLTLIIVIINFVSLRRLQSNIEATVDEASRVRELSQEIANEFLLARQEEQEFLENWRALGFENAWADHIAVNQEHIATARASLSELDSLIAQSTTSQFDQVREEVRTLQPALDAYESSLQITVNRIEERSQAGGLEVRLQDTIDELTDMATTVPNSIELNRTIVEMSAAEQAFFNTGEQQFLDQTRLLALQAADLLNTTPQLDWAYSPQTRPRLLDAVMRRSEAFDDLVQLEQEISINADISQEITSNLTDSTSSIGDEAAKALNASRGNLAETVTRSTRLTAIIGLLALAAGSVVAWFLARRIINPLNELTAAARQVGEGNLNTSVEVRGQDEFATLGRVFNQMSEQLRTLIGSLERMVSERTRALSTSYQVSRRLSTILDQRQLVAEVVEQIRSSFDFYHVHIYLFDEDSEYLIMVGGTGEAGRTMLNSGHRLRRGQGLVGKAATTKKAVIVPDVRQDSNWLPNPLLPGTKSEIAVPIMLGDQVSGVLDVQHDIRDGLNQSDAELLQSIANQVAIALQNAQLYEDARLAAERETTVNIINQKIQKAVTVEGALQIAAQELGKALEARRTVVQLGRSSPPVDRQKGDGRSTNGRSSKAEK